MRGIGPASVGSPSMAEPLFRLPQGDALTLDVAPRLASWMRKGHPDQVRLDEFLDHAEARVAARLRAVSEPLSLRLDVGLPPGVDPLHERDLDNFLFPLACRLGTDRFVSAWATKRTAPQSTIRVEPARHASDEGTWQVRRARSVRSATSVAWKEEIRAQLEPVDPLPDGPAALQLSFTVGPGRTWTNLWKQAIDTLEPILGSAAPGREWHPRDGRVVMLGLHRATDPALGHAVEIAVRWRLASWEELGSR